MTLGGTRESKLTMKRRECECVVTQRNHLLTSHTLHRISDLFMRYEEPNAMTRWDSPLFVISNDPTAEQCISTTTTSTTTTTDGFPKQSWEPAPLDQIWQTITSGKITKAPNVVSQNRTTSTNYLSLLESSTQSLVSSILSYGTLPPNGGQITLSPRADFTLNITLPSDKRPPTAPQLQRLRRQFVKIHSTSFATGNILGKEAKDEGAGKDDALALDESAAEDKIIKRFAVWLSEILHAQP